MLSTACTFLPALSNIMRYTDDSWASIKERRLLSSPSYKNKTLKMPSSTASFTLCVYLAETIRHPTRACPFAIRSCVDWLFSASSWKVPPQEVSGYRAPIPQIISRKTKASWTEKSATSFNGQERWALSFNAWYVLPHPKRRPNFNGSGKERSKRTRRYSYRR